MILYIENCKDSTKKKKNLLERVNKYSKLAGYKISIQKSPVLLYVNNELAERKLIKQSHLQSQQRDKIPRNKFC